MQYIPYDGKLELSRDTSCYAIRVHCYNKNQRFCSSAYLFCSTVLIEF